MKNFKNRRAMKKIVFAAAVFAFMLSAISCSREEQLQEREVFEYTFAVGNGDAAGADAKSVLASDSNGLFLAWESTDKLNSWADYASGYSYNNQSSVNADSSPVTFTIKSYRQIAAGTTVYAVYPYSSSRSSDTTPVTTLTIPGEQTQAGSSFDASAMPMVAMPFGIENAITTVNGTAEQSAVSFFNMAGLIEFDIFSPSGARSGESVLGVTFDADQAAAGSFSFDLRRATDAANLTYSGYSLTSVSTSVTGLSVGDATDRESAKKVYMAVAPGNYTGTVSVITDAAVYTYAVSSAKTVARAGVKQLGINLEKLGARAPFSSTTLSNANIVAGGDAASGYGDKTVTDGSGFTYTAYAIKNYHSKATSAYQFLQLKKYAAGTASYIHVPEIGSRIVTISMTVSNASTTMDGGGNAATLFFSSDNSTSAGGSGVASGTGAATVTINAYPLNLNTGYITSSGGVRIWDMEIRYIAGPRVATATVYTGSATGTGATAATLSGSYSGATGTVEETGFCWGTSEGSLDNELYVDSGSGASGEFSGEVTSLSESTTYYYKAYALEYNESTSSYEYRYGSVKSFTTSAASYSTPTGWLELPSYTTGGMSGTTASSLSDLYLVRHSASGLRNYTALYDPETFASYWVAYPLASCYLGSGRENNWAYDPDVPSAKQTNCVSGAYSVNIPTANYDNNYYSRGHQIPNADRTASTDLSDQTFYMTNITPQLQYGFNGGIWNDLETAIRGLVSAGDTVYVVTGAAFRKKGGSETVDTITNSRDGKTIPVPNYYWKVLLKVKWSGGAVTSASTIGFWLPHGDLKDESYEDPVYITSVDQIEAWTGFDFFANLSVSMQASAEDNTDWTDFRNF